MTHSTDAGRELHQRSQHLLQDLNSVRLDLEKLELLPPHWNDLCHVAAAVKLPTLYSIKP